MSSELLSYPVIYSILPDGFEISTNSYGNCLIASKFVSANTTIYHESIPLIEESLLSSNYVLVISNRPEITPIKLDPNIHFVRVDNKRQRYGFESFTNHSCHPNTRPVNWHVFDDYIEFDTVALKDIHVGDEICCNYALFDYDCYGHEISKCYCGHTDCLGSMLGFKNLPESSKKELRPLVLPLMLEYHDRFVSDKI